MTSTAGHKAARRGTDVNVTTADNYRYWQEEGSSWPAEYDHRKTYQPDVHIQEAMLALYMSQSAPAKVLEYGCGFGRHLSYLRDIPGIDINGYDQSPTMLRELGRTFDPAWVKEHVTLGAPVGALPYADGTFDIAYTAEVLVHVRPDDVRTILRELLRISKWHVLHIEPSEEVKIVSDAHAGCWRHDLVAIYRDLGYECEVLPSIYSSHDVFRVTLSRARTLFTWSPVVARLQRRANLDLRHGLADRDQRVLALEAERGRYNEANSALSAELGTLKARLEQLDIQLRDERSARLRLAEQVETEGHVLSVLYGAAKYAFPDAPILNSGHVEQVAGRLRDLKNEVDYLKAKRGYRFARRVRSTRAYDWARWAKNRNDAVVQVRATGDRNPNSQGNEVWVVGARESASAPAVPWDYFEVLGGDWVRQGNFTAPYGEHLKASSGSVRVPVSGQAPLLSIVKHAAGGQCEVTWRDKSAVFDTYNGHPLLVTIRCSDEGIALDEARVPTTSAPLVVDGELVSAAQPRRAVAPARVIRPNLAQLESFRASRPIAVAIHTPKWLGVSSSTRALFSDCYEYPVGADGDPTQLDEAAARVHASALIDSGVKHFVVSGGDLSQLALVRELKRLEPKARVDLLWHASYVQCTEDYTWTLLQAWVEAARGGLVAKIGTVKKGMEGFLRSLGVQSEFVMNYVDRIPTGASTPDPDGPHVGVWLSGESYRKLPYAMLAAIKMAAPATLRTANLSKRSLEFIQFTEIEMTEQHRGPLSAENLLTSMARTHASLYVTFSECAPMLPLESFSVGVPCVFGANSHLFEDDDVLRDACVVEYADRADKILEKLENVIVDRGNLVERYRKYAVGYNERARASVKSFLG